MNPASFLKERFPTSLPTGQAGGNDKTCAITYGAVYNNAHDKKLQELIYTPIDRYPFLFL